MGKRSKMANNKYSDEFKSEAVKLASSIGFPKASLELGVNQKSIRDWSKATVPVDSKDKKSKRRADKVAELEAELRRTQKEVKRLRLINDVLKKSTAIFSNHELGD